MKLEIKIPKFATQWQDWTDHEKVVLSFLHYCYAQSEIKPATELYLHQHDMMRMLNRYGTKNGFSGCLDGLRRVYRIGQTNDYTLQICLQDEFRKGVNWNGRPKSEMTYITEPSAIAIWFYLAGRCTESDIFDEPQPWRKNTYARDFFWRAPAVI